MEKTLQGNNNRGQAHSSNDSYEVSSNSNTNTFRDTELDEFEASNLMKIQSLTSIINDPKSDTFYKQLSAFIQKPDSFGFKQLKESQIPDSAFDIYKENHDRTYQEDQTKGNSTKNKVQTPLDPNLKQVPDEFFDENFRLNKPFFQISSNDSALKYNESLAKYLEIIESNLVRNIQSNFDFFTDAFNNFDGMKDDLKMISQKAQNMKMHNEKIKAQNLQKMLKVYHLQRQKSNIAKVNEKLKYLSLLKQSLPVIANLIDSGSNFEVVLDLIQNSNELIDNKLVYKQRLKEFNFKCKKRLESECLNLIEMYLNSRIQFIKPNITEDYKQKFNQNLKFYFDAEKVLSKVGLEFIHRNWTINFEDNYIMNNAVTSPAEVKFKKDVFKYISEQSDQNIYNSFMLLGILLSQILSSLQNMERIVKDTVLNYQRNYLEERDLENISNKDRKLIERKHDLFLKNVVDEFQDTYNKVKQYFTTKLEKNWKRINEKNSTLKISSEDFQQQHFFMMTLIDNLKAHFKINPINITSVSEEYQKKFVLDFKSKKTDELKMLLDNELWTHSQVNPFFQIIVDKINSIELFDQPDQEQDQQNQLQPKDSLSTPDCEYKIVTSLIKFIHMVFEFLRIIRNFPQVSFEGASRLIEFIKFYNSVTCQLILGSGAFYQKKLESITAKHLSLTANCLCFVLDEIPFIQSQVAINLNEIHLKHIDAEFVKLSEDLKNHKNGIFEKLQQMVTDSIQDNCDEAKGKIEWDKQLEKGDKVAVNPYIQSISKDVTNMHKVLSGVLPKHSIEIIFGQIFRFLMKTFDDFYASVNTQTKYGKSRIKVDLKYFQKSLMNLKFEDENLQSMVNQKINTILTARCGIKNEES
ncbi:UNKNOWN [Stylonychia lemnae]|uniref:Vacuolar protein sorting-associated protein 54 C-terminal domain-containing protein n=1 Tax=Stylonychia lemnae TaxID=5949 RepID=A0A077ZYT1_STYLE|nr:UNKNOWN [Stylonychia lemnae]|eukprot:CDW75065.1 UNKNOWN [Stylonychia lemnae]